MSSIKLKHSSGNSMSIGAPATNPASDLELKLPATVGAANQFLKNSGTAGTLAWSNVTEDSGKVNILPGGTLSGNAPPGDLNIVGTNFLTMTPNDGANASDNEVLGQISFLPYAAGTVAAASAKIEAVAESGQSGSANPSMLTFYTKASSAGPGSSATERSRITSNGSQFWFCTSEPSSSVSGCSIMNNQGEIRMGNSGTGNTTRLRFYNANGEVGSIKTNGSATAFNTSSDYRLKENQVAISDGITRLKTLKPYKFNFKVDPTTTVDGFFAHEVTAVPEAISGSKDAVDSDDKIIPQGIDQSKLVPLLTAALQEAITKIETLETKVAALEAV